MKLKQWLRKHNAFFFTLSHGGYEPGFIFDKQKVFLGPSTFVHVGQAWTRLALPAEEFAPVPHPAAIATGTWTRTFGGNIKAGLANVGVDASGSMKSIRALSVTSKGLTAESLDADLWDPGMLAGMLEPVVDERPAYLAYTMYYAESLRISFAMKGSAEAQAKLAGRLEAHGDASLSWANASTVDLSFGAKVPFAFSGPKI